MNGTIETLKVIADLGATAAVLFVVWIFMRHIKEQRESFLETIRNHLDHSTQAIDQLKSVLTTWLAAHKD